MPSNPRTGAIAPSLILSMVFMQAHAAGGIESTRGEMLYSTHCIACHTTHVHWREKRLATDWDSLSKQVRRWEENTSLHWDDDDVYAVSQYLNDRYYHFPIGKKEKALSYAEDHDEKQ